jgi:hypothetical protein
MAKVGEGDLRFSKDDGEDGPEERNSLLEGEGGGGDEGGVSLCV